MIWQLLLILLYFCGTYAYNTEYDRYDYNATLDDEEGNLQQVNNGELIKYSEGGKLMFDINGNIDDIMLEYVNGVDGEGGWKEKFGSY